MYYNITISQYITVLKYITIYYNKFLILSVVSGKYRQCGVVFEGNYTCLLHLIH